ncbi:MAG: Asp-tRNA(Asn)/Glu-tRNA(Gln) amidotransferase GatCAB subunit C, partial [Paracoccaceae bacterium]
GTVVTDTTLRRNVVQMSTGSWFDPLDPSDPYSLCKHGNPNVLTRDKGTSKLGQGPSAHTCLVSVELFSGIPPKVTAHEPPEIIRK